MLNTPPSSNETLATPNILGIRQNNVPTYALINNLCKSEYFLQIIAPIERLCLGHFDAGLLSKIGAILFELDHFGILNFEFS